MKACELQASGVVELYFYDELAPAARSSIASHVAGCEECRRALEELSVIRDALAARPPVDAPLDGDWTAFMIRLDESIRGESGRDQPARVADTRADVVAMPARWTTPGVSRFAPYVALAAVLTLVTSGIVYMSRHVTPREGISRPTIAERATPTDAPPAEPSVQSVSAATGFTALSEQHFERSKLVVFGLANKDPKQTDGADWAYERGLASSLLDDTRLYRMAAEERGMKTLAGVMGDLEIVLLQTSLADSPDPDALERIQRLIHKRDLVTKMEVAGDMGS
jgi:hypothetical protein